MKILKENVNEVNTERNEGIYVGNEIKDVMNILTKAGIIFGDDAKLICDLLYAKTKLERLIEDLLYQ